MAKIYDLKKTLKSNPEIAKLILPSSKSEIFFDLDGKGHIDFAYIDGKGTGEVDTFAFDMTGDGSLDVYFVDYDGNGVAETVKYYPDGADTPAQVFVDKKIERAIGPLSDALYAAMQSEDAAAIVAAIRSARDGLLEKGLTFGTNGTLGVCRRKLMANADMAKLICPSAINEIYLDLNGDGKADFAFIDSKGTGSLDTFALDFAKDGEFDLYLTDTDNNGLFDSVRYFANNSDELTYSSAAGDKVMEETMAPCIEKFRKTLRSQWDVPTLAEALNTFKAELFVALNDWYKKTSK